MPIYGVAISDQIIGRIRHPHKIYFDSITLAVRCRCKINIYASTVLFTRLWLVFSTRRGSTFMILTPKRCGSLTPDDPYKARSALRPPRRASKRDTGQRHAVTVKVYDAGISRSILGYQWARNFAEVAVPRTVEPGAGGRLEVCCVHKSLFQTLCRCDILRIIVIPQARPKGHLIRAFGTTKYGSSPSLNPVSRLRCRYRISTLFLFDRLWLTPFPSSTLGLLSTTQQLSASLVSST